MPRSRRRRVPEGLFAAKIETFTEDGNGVARVDDRRVRVFGALPGETVRFRYTGRRRKNWEGAVVEVLDASPDRVAPRCAHFGLCGGCSQQHLDADARIGRKLQSLLDALGECGVPPESVLPPLRGPRWGYRRKARLGVKDVAAKGRVLVGFRERGKPYVAEIDRCEILHPRVGGLLRELSDLIGGLSVRDRIPQIEMAMGDETLALVFRVLDPPSQEDLERLRGFGNAHDLMVCLQEGGYETIRALEEAPPELSYRPVADGPTLYFGPADFTQVNLDINRQMVGLALELLDLKPDDRVLDLFCGIGNFTLPLAQRAGRVVGVEGDAALVERARDNARRNGIDNAEFHTTDLYRGFEDAPWLAERFDKLLLDPPRTGAAEVIPHLARLGVERIVYVSCFPPTLARDAASLVHELGYRLVSAGVMDMFPHTAHVESIALFER